MPKLTCSCGCILNLQDIPCKIQYNFISDEEYDKYHGSIQAEELYHRMKMFFKCQECDSLWFFWDGFDGEPIEYARISSS